MYFIYTPLYLYDSNNSDSVVTKRGKEFFVVVFLFFFETEFRSCYAVWSAMALLRLTSSSASLLQAILLPRPPE